jgi:acyl dehydratase
MTSPWASPGKNPTGQNGVAETIKPENLPALAGQELEPSAWLEITQERIDLFAEATNDHQYIHVDPEKAAETPFGATIAHGFLTLSLLSYLNAQNTRMPEGLVMGINYGSDKVRFIKPVVVGQRIRTRQKVLRVSQKSPGNWLIKTAVTVEIENEKKPALIAEILSMFVVEQ